MTRAVVRLLTVVALVATALLLPSAGREPASTANAADLSYFQPGNIIADAVFFDALATDVGTVQAFLDAKGAKCVAGAMPCLKDYTQTTADQAGDAYCAAYHGATNETAAAMLVKIGAACGINPRVLIVLLQKEQGLITGTTPTATAYTKATGFACPDTSPCNPAFSGFVSQVYFAARQFQRYAAGVAGSYRAGRYNTVLYNPNAGCGSTQVYIENKATAGLYSYTPYQPNAAALAAGYGKGDDCSSYGNRNFWNYFTDWFGSTQSTAGGAIYLKYQETGGAAGTLGAPVTSFICGLANGGCFQNFASGAIYWTPTTGAHAITGSIQYRWGQLRWETSFLGYPISDTWCRLAGGGCFQQFQGGSLYATSPTAPAYFVRGVIAAQWGAAGYENGSLGFPTSDENCGLVGGGCFNDFQHGAIYWSPSVGAHIVSGAVRDKWNSLGYERGALGYPISDTYCGLVNGGCFQQFQTGSIYSTTSSGAHLVRGAIRDKWGVAGWEGGVLGYPTGDEVCGLKDGGCSETFQKGAIYWSPATAARVVLAAVKAPWSAQGGIDGAAGYPVTDSFCGLANGGCYQGFQGGSFYYSPAGGGHLVRGAILAKWGSLRWENGVLGYPTGDEVCGLTGGGCSQAFQNGAIYWSPSTGALVVSGDVGVAWKARGGAASDLGYPLSDTYCGLTAGGCFQIFQFGSIYWSTGTGGHLVRGGIRDRWGATGWEGGSLGYPLTDENCGLVNGGCFEKFERGSIYWTPVTGAHSVSGAIRDAWAGQGYEGGAWGYPTDEPASTGSGTVQHFTGGTATFDATAGTVTFR